MVPEVGGEAIEEVRGSIDAMAELTRRIVESGAETVVLISPHAPLDPHAFVAYQTPLLYGDFADFRAPATKVEFPLDEELLQAIKKAAAHEDFAVSTIAKPRSRPRHGCPTLLSTAIWMERASDRLGLQFSFQ